MIFGNPHRFAIECNIEFPDDNPVAGHMCIWAANRRIGNIDQLHVIWNPVTSLRATLSHAGRRSDESFQTETPAEILRIVEDGVYGDWDEPAYTDARCDAEFYYRRFMLCPTDSPPFDGELTALLEVENAARFMWRDIETRQVCEILLDNGEYEAVVQEFLHWVDPIIKWDPRSVHLSGRVFVFAGQLRRYTRQELMNLVRQYGGYVETTVTKQTTNVIAGRLDPLAQEKVDRALLAGAQVTAEEDFRSLLPLDQIDVLKVTSTSGA